MERHCSSCGARISDDMKICGNCGKIIPPQRSRQEFSRESKRDSTIKPLPQKNTTRQYNKQKPIPQSKRRVSQQPEKQNVIAIKGNRNIKKWIKLIIVIFIIYTIISLVQIFRVRFTGYEFKSTDMKMSQDNFGQAIDNFFESGHWVYNPFTLTVKYSGETVEGNEYKLKFSTFLSVDVKKIEVDGEEKADSQIESALMGMFI